MEKPLHTFSIESWLSLLVKLSVNSTVWFKMEVVCIGVTREDLGVLIS